MPKADLDDAEPPGDGLDATELLLEEEFLWTVRSLAVAPSAVEAGR